MPTSKQRWLTVDMAAGELGVSGRSVRRWIKDSTEETVPRKRIRLRDRKGDMRLTLVVEYGALVRYSDTLN